MCVCVCVCVYYNILQNYHVNIYDSNPHQENMKIKKGQALVFIPRHFQGNLKMSWNKDESLTTLIFIFSCEDKYMDLHTYIYMYIYIYIYTSRNTRNCLCKFCLKLILSLSLKRERGGGGEKRVRSGGLWALQLPQGAEIMEIILI